MRPVAALYVDPHGIYLGMPGVSMWTYRRNAKLYDGPDPVIAHPPCGPWSRLKFLCTKQDPTCGPRAVDQVQKWGGRPRAPERQHALEALRAAAPG